MKTKNGYPDYVVFMVFCMLMGASLPVCWAFYSGDWRWLAITAVSLAGLMIIP